MVYLYFSNAQKVKFLIKDFPSKCDQVHSFLLIWSHLLKESLMENSIFWTVQAADEECFVLKFFWDLVKLINDVIFAPYFFFEIFNVNFTIFIWRNNFFAVVLKSS